MEIRPAIDPADIAAAVALDPARADYITQVAQKRGLSVACLDGQVAAFACLDHAYFFEKPFVSLLMVADQARRKGLGRALLTSAAGAYPEVWTSTNTSNAPMRALLDALGWHYCGTVEGLDAGDPERFYKSR